MTSAPKRFGNDQGPFVDLLRGVQDAKAAGIEQAQCLFAEFKLELERYIAREEEVLFPSFDKSTGAEGLTAVMRVEHRQIRHLLEEIGAKLFAGDMQTDAEQIVLLELLKAHQRQEKDVVYKIMERPARPPEPRPPNAATGRARFLDACHCRPVDRPPIWMMRQAGRCLPEYRALKEKHPFLELVRTPELAAEVTLQPVRRFGFDAAILFSDILVVPEAMGQGYRFRDTGGIEMEFALRDAGDIKRLSEVAIEERLHYVYEAMTLTRRQLGGGTALLGFAGSPWTLANFMLEGGSTKTPVRALQLLESDPPLFSLLMEKLSLAVAEFLRLQILGGADAVQIFDSLGGLLPFERFEAGSGSWMRQVIAGLGSDLPVIVFSKGTRNWSTLFGLGANALSLDPRVDLCDARCRFPGTMAIQGNLDPEHLTALTPDELKAATLHLLEKMRGRPGYIFNLGHGVPPATPLEAIASVTETVRQFS